MTKNQTFSAYPKAECDSAEIYWNGNGWVVDKPNKPNTEFHSLSRALAWAELNEEETNYE